MSFPLPHLPFRLACSEWVTPEKKGVTHDAKPQSWNEKKV